MLLGWPLILGPVHIAFLELIIDPSCSIVFEAESGEDAAIKAYKEALGTTLPANVGTLIQTQYAGVQEAHNTIRNLKHSLQAATA